MKICENGACRTEQREGNLDVDSLLHEKKTQASAQVPVLSVVPDPDSAPVQNSKKTQCMNGTCTTKICENGKISDLFFCINLIQFRVLMCQGNCRFEQHSNGANAGYDPEFLNKP